MQVSKSSKYNNDNNFFFSFMLPIPLGEVIIMHATILKKGRTMAFTECEFRRKSDNKLLAKGKHNLALLPYLKSEEARQF